MFAQVYVVILTLAFAQLAFAAACSRTYTVKEGDFCNKISQEQHVSTYQLAVNNPSLIDQGCSNLKPGESICLGVTNEDCSTTHIVGADDTCEKIATANGLNMTILRMNNPQLDQNCEIYDGEVLCTSNTVQVAPIPASGVPKSTAVPQPAPPQPAPPQSAPLPPSPTSTSTTSTSSFPMSVATISFPTSGTVSLATDHKTASTPQPTESDSESDSDLPFCDEL